MSFIIKDGKGVNRVMFSNRDLISELEKSLDEDIVVTIRQPCGPLTSVEFGEELKRVPLPDGAGPRTVRIPSNKSTNSGFSMTTLFLSLIILLLVLRLNKII